MCDFARSLLTGFESESSTNKAGIKNPTATPKGVATVAIVVAIILPFSLNHKADTLAGELVKNGCPIAAIIYPTTQTAKLWLTKHLINIPINVNTVPSVTPTLHPYLSIK
jgi:hypothetical protein